MNKDLQESSNLKLQDSLRRILELADNGNFYIEYIAENAAGTPLDKLNAEDLCSCNKISLNLTIQLVKLPGMENKKSGVSNLVNSTIVDPGNYYNEAVSNAIQELKDKGDILDAVNKMIGSKVGDVIDGMILNDKNDHDLQIKKKVKEEILKEMSKSAVKEDINKYLQIIIEQNLTDPEFISKLQASVNYDMFKKSIISKDKIDFSQCINSYLGNRIDMILQQKRDDLIDDIKNTHPEVAQSQRFHDFINSKLFEQNEKIKSNMLIKINENTEADISKLKQEMIDNFGNDDKLNEVLNQFMFDNVGGAVENVQHHIEIRETNGKEGNEKFHIELAREINGHLSKALMDNIPNSTFREVSTVVTMKSSVNVTIKKSNI